MEFAGQLDTSALDAEAPVGPKGQVIEDGRAAEIHPVAGQIDGIAVLRAGKVLGIPVQPVVPAHPIAQFVRNETQGDRLAAQFGGQPESCLEKGVDQVGIHDSVQLALDLAAQEVGEIRNGRGFFT